MEQTEKLKEIREQRYSELEDVKQRNIVDMALGFTAMMRLFEEGSKETIQAEILQRLPRFYASRSEEVFKAAHNDFCMWGVGKILTAEKKKKGKVIKETAPASYGHMAKILDVVLHVVIRYAHRPDCQTAERLSAWLNPAMDTRMMDFLAGCYPDALKPWPKTIEQVKEKDYEVIQQKVRQFIKEEHQGKILPVDFDDIYWEALNRKVARPAIEQ